MSLPRNKRREASQEIEAVLREWRERALDILYKVIAFVALAGLIIHIVADRVLATRELGVTLVFVFIYGIYLWVTFDRSLSTRFRGWALLVVLYAIAIISMVRGGLVGDGRMLLFTLPIAAVILVGTGAAYISVAISVATMLIFIALSYTGWLQIWMLESVRDQPHSVGTWLVEGMYTILLFFIALALVVMFYQFLIRVLDRQIVAQKEVQNARRLLQEYNQTLEEKVAARSAESTEALRQAQEARASAEQANRAKSAFLATMSHELRTPLSAIIGMTTLLLDTPMSSKQQEFTQVVRQSGETLLSLINDILDFSKVEAGRMDLSPQPFVLRHCLEKVMNLIAPRAAEKNLNLACLFEKGVPESIVADEPRLSQVLMNLLSNAVKFTESGEVTVTIAGERLEVTPSQPAIHRLCFSVTDTGIGIAPEHIDRLFQPFQQIENSGRERYNGTGLGLVISQRLVELMGGAIQVESRPGQGSTFWFAIDVPESNIQLHPLQPDDRLKLADKRILVVDDNDTNRRILTLEIQSWGMAPCCTARPAEALEWLRSGEQFSAALIDMQMSEMNGAQLAEKIRALPAGKTLPMVLLTSLGSEDAFTVPNFFSSVLTKPVKASLLYNSLIGIFAGEINIALRGQPASAGSLFDPQMGKRFPLRILVVEDNPINQNLVSLMLERLGYKASVASNGLEALKAVHTAIYDVVLMDVQMPEMDGLEATRRIRSGMPQEIQPRIIAMTANAMSGDREACLTAGMNDYISKPIHVEALINGLKSAGRLPDPTPEQLAEMQAAAGEPGVLGDGLNWANGVHAVLDSKELERLQQILGARARDMLPNLIANYYRQAEKLMDDIESSLQGAAEPAGDFTGNGSPTGEAAYATVRRLAHTLKSNSASFGAVRLASAARELENLARLENLQNGLALLARCRQEFALTREALDCFQQEELNGGS